MIIMRWTSTRTFPAGVSCLMSCAGLGSISRYRTTYAHTCALGSGERAATRCWKYAGVERKITQSVIMLIFAPTKLCCVRRRTTDIGPVYATGALRMHFCPLAYCGEIWMIQIVPEKELTIVETEIHNKRMRKMAMNI